MDEVIKGMDNTSEGSIKIQDDQMNKKNVDERLMQSSTDDISAGILSHVGDILFSQGQNSARARSAGTKTPDTAHGKVNSSIPQVETTFPVPPTKAISNVQSQVRTEWQPSRLFHHESPESDNQFALLVLNQPIENKNVFRVIWEKAFFRIAADGAGNRLLDISRDRVISDLIQNSHYQLHIICGDLDSLKSNARQSFESRGTQIVHIKDQDSTDFQKCTNYLRERVLPTLPNPSNILCLGGLGGRVDQGLSQLHQLYKEQHDHGYGNGRIYLLTTEALTFVLLSGKHRINVRDITVPSVLGRHIGIIPLKEPSIITTKGLEWDVTDWKTEFGGQISTSNLVREDVVEVTTTHDVLFTIDLDFTSIEKVSMKGNSN